MHNVQNIAWWSSLIPNAFVYALKNDPFRLKDGYFHRALCKNIFTKFIYLFLDVEIDYDVLCLDQNLVWCPVQHIHNIILFTPFNKKVGILSSVRTVITFTIVYVLFYSKTRLQSEEIVSELVHSFLLPEVQKITVREKGNLVTLF